MAVIGEKIGGEIRDDHNLQKILMILRSKTGHDFSLYKKTTVYPCSITFRFLKE